jgi:enamine deaminase RidA (YjgF/YER057c/UK114 family)
MAKSLAVPKGPFMRALTPDSIHPPFARYAHGVEIPAGARLVFCSGQLGIGKNGTVPDGVEAQARLCFGAIAAILKEAGMTLGDIVRINAYVVGAEYLTGYMRVRDEFIGNPPPASTLMIVHGFARPEFKVEVEAVAARAP